MIIQYNTDNGDIVGRVYTDSLSVVDFEQPVISVPDDTDLANKCVDVDDKQLVWDCTLKEAKSDKIQEIKDRAYEVLSETDWDISRKQETGEAIPQDVLDHRPQVRADSDTFEQEVNNLTTVEEVLNYDYNFPEPPKP